MCDNICDKENKYVDSLCCGGCKVARLKLELNHRNGKVVYRVINSGTVNICRDVFVCSYYFGKIKIKNELLLPNESLETEELDYVLSYKNEKQGTFWAEVDKEKARAFTEVSCKKFIYSNEIDEVIELGVDLTPIIDHNQIDNDVFSITVGVTNSLLSSGPAKNVKFTIPLYGRMLENLVSYSGNGKVTVTLEGNIITGHVDTLEKGESLIVVLVFNNNITGDVVTYIIEGNASTDNPRLLKAGGYLTLYYPFFN